jgi:hypothetical protein
MLSRVRIIFITCQPESGREPEELAVISVTSNITDSASLGGDYVCRSRQVNVWTPLQKFRPNPNRHERQMYIFAAAIASSPVYSVGDQKLIRKF